MCVVPAKVVCNVGVRGAQAVVGLEVRPLVLHASTQALDEHVLAPSAAPAHRQLAARATQHRVGELTRGELAPLVGVDDLGRAVLRERLLDEYFEGADKQ